MSSGLALQILEHTHEANKELYRAALASVAEMRKVRPLFFERAPPSPASCRNGVSDGTPPA